MGVRTFQVDGVDVSIEDRLMRQEIRWNHQLISKCSKLRPRLSHVHRFAASDPVRQYELRTYEPGPGWMVLRDGDLVASEPPGKAVTIMWLVIAALNVATLIAEPRQSRAVVTVLTVTVAVGMLLPYLSWRRMKRRHERRRKAAGAAAR